MTLPQTPESWKRFERDAIRWARDYPQATARLGITDDMRAMVDDLERTGSKTPAGSVRTLIDVFATSPFNLWIAPGFDCALVRIR